jgi:hypothetical protein
MFFWNSPGTTAVATSATTAMWICVGVIPTSLAGAGPAADVLEPPDAVVVDPAVVELVDFLLDDPHALSTSTAVRTMPTTW